MMMHQPCDTSTGARREAPAEVLSVTPLAPEPSLAEMRARNLLALSLLNHRACPDLDAEDVAVVRDALLGGWDAA